MLNCCKTLKTTPTFQSTNSMLSSSRRMATRTGEQQN